VVAGAVVALALLGGSTMAGASVPDAARTFTGCVSDSTGVLRVIDTAKAGTAGSCISTGPAVLRETAISWGAQGPQGVPGPPGPQGDAAAPSVPHTEVVGFLDLPGLAADPIALRGVTLDAELLGGAGDVGGGAGGAAEVGDLVVAKAVDAASPSLTEQAATGAHRASALVRLTDADGASYVELQLTDVVVRSVVTDSSDAAGELVTLGFGSIAVVSGAGATPVPSTPIGTLASPGLPVVSPIVSLSWGVANTGGGFGGGGGGGSQLDDVVVTQPIDANAVSLFNALLTGIHLPAVTVVQDLPNVDDVYALTDVVVHTATVELTGAAGAVPVVETGLAYAEVDRSVGGQSFCWDTVVMGSC